MASVVRGILNGIKEKGIGGFAKHLRNDGYLNCIFDGNLVQTKIHNIGATLIGVDKFGNKYYEKLHDTQYGEAQVGRVCIEGKIQCVSSAAEWHGWLHYITDRTGDELLMLKPKRYGAEHKENLSGKERSSYITLRATH